MLDDIKKLKEKAKKSAGRMNPAASKELDKDVENIIENSRTSIDREFKKSSDKVRRSAGKIRGKFTPPKSETKRGFTKEVTYFFCADCNSKLGPMETKKWKNLLKAILGGAGTAAGVATLNPILIFKGSTSLASLKKDDRGMIDKIRGDKKLNEKAKNYLMQCEYCGEWVCSDCFETEKLICTRCGEEGQN